MNLSMNGSQDMGSRVQSAMDWCLPKIKSTNNNRINALVIEHKWATENLDAQRFFRYTDGLVALALDFIADDRFVDFATREFREA